MKITKITIYQSPIALKQPFIISLGVLTIAENVIVTINTDSGYLGFGECSPFKTINGESMQSAFIVAQYLAKVLIGSNPLDIAQCTALMDAVIFGNNSIKSAFDIALYDIAAQHARLPLYAFLGGNNAKTLLSDYTISMAQPDKMASDALAVVANGFRVIKVKLGQGKQIDVQRMHSIRNAVGYKIPIRIDANQGWDTNEAVEILNELAPFNIQHCEEPIARYHFMDLPAIRQQSPIPIMADESCCDHHDAKRLMDIKACDMINIKLGKSGGIFKALKIMALADDANIGLQVGGFLESRLAFTASAHVALVSKQAIIHCDFDSPLMLQHNPVLGGITYNPVGEITLPTQPGLGAAVDESYLASLVKIIIT